MLLDCVNLRYQLMPYIYTAARQAYDTGVSICRPLYYEWPEENEAYRQEGEYMFGDNILVSPVVTAANNSNKTFHKTWLPSGMWYDVTHNEMVQGGTTISHYYGLGDIPYFIKAGAIVVENPKMKNLKKSPDQYIVKVIPGEVGEASLYEDEGDTQAYADGAFTTTTFRQKRSASELSLTIDPRQGAFEGMPSQREYQVVFILEEQPLTVTIDGTETDDWSYDAEMQQVKVNVPATACDQQIVITLQRSANGISQMGDATIVEQRYFDLQGREHTYAPQGTYIVRRIWNNGKVSTQKVIQ